ELSGGGRQRIAPAGAEHDVRPVPQGARGALPPEAGPDSRHEHRLAVEKHPHLLSAAGRTFQWSAPRSRRAPLTGWVAAVKAGTLGLFLPGGPARTARSHLLPGDRARDAIRLRL